MHIETHVETDKETAKHRYAPGIVALIKWAGWREAMVIYEDAISYTGSLVQTFA